MCNHRWIVFSADLECCFISVQCSKCHAKGRVSKPSQRELKKAFFATSLPYVWTGGCFRVSILRVKSDILLAREKFASEYELCLKQGRKYEKSGDLNSFFS